MVQLFGLRSLMELFWKAQSLDARTSVILLAQTRVLEKRTSLGRILAARVSSALGFEDASLSDSLVYGVSVWDARMTGASQSNLVITPENQPRISVDDLEVAQFIYLLLKNERIRDVISTIAKKAVLILGRFSEERKEILDAIANALREKDFLPIIFDFERSQERDFTETIMILAGLSRFVIADITNPKSTPLELQATVPDYMIPFVPIIQEGEAPFSMFEDLKRKYDWVLDRLEYDSKDALLNALDDAVINPALLMEQTLVNRKAEQSRARHVRDFQRQTKSN